MPLLKKVKLLKLTQDAISSIVRIRADLIDDTEQLQTVNLGHCDLIENNLTEIFHVVSDNSDTMEVKVCCTTCGHVYNSIALRYNNEQKSNNGPWEVYTSCPKCQSKSEGDGVIHLYVKKTKDEAEEGSKDLRGIRDGTSHIMNDIESIDAGVEVEKHYTVTLNMVKTSEIRRYVQSSDFIQIHESEEDDDDEGDDE